MSDLSMFDLDQAEDERKFAEEQKAFRNEKSNANTLRGVVSGLGGVLQAEADVPSAYEYLYNKKMKPTDFQSGAGRAAGMIKDPTDPSETSRKAMEYMKLKREGRQMQSADDPTSGDADSFRQQLYAIAPSMKGKFDGMTLAQMERGSPMLMAQFKAQGDERMARIAAGARAGEKADARAEKAEAAQLTRDEKKKASLVEIEDRRRNIEDNVTLLEKMIEDNGTYELTGSHNADLDRRVDMIATDMAKLADPNSVARPAEVELFKKGLVHSTMNPANLSNGTALNLLKNFRGELDSRVANAYKIREAQDPGSQTLRDNGGKRTVVKQERNKKTGEMRVTYSDGSKEVISSTAASK